MKNYDVVVLCKDRWSWDIFDFVEWVSSKHMISDGTYDDRFGISHEFKMPPIQLFMNDTFESLHYLMRESENTMSMINVVIRGSSSLADHIYDCIKRKKNISDYNQQYVFVYFVSVI